MTKVIEFDTNTVNIDIFTCIDFRGFTKIGNFVWINIHV